MLNLSKCPHTCRKPHVIKLQMPESVIRGKMEEIVETSHESSKEQAEMISAIEAGDISRLQNCLKNDDNASKVNDVMSVNGVQMTCLVFAVQTQQPEVVRFLLDHGVHVRDNRNWEALHCAIVNDDMASVRYLLASGINVDTQDSENRNHTPLTRAIMLKRLDILKLILYVNPDVNLTGFAGKTPLFLAHKEGWQEGFDLLLAHGASPYIPSMEITSVLHEAMSLPDTDWLQYLLDSIPLDGSRTVNESWQGLMDHALYVAVQYKCPVHMSYLIKRGANVTRDVSSFLRMPPGMGSLAGSQPASLLHVAVDCFKCRVTHTMFSHIQRLSSIRVKDLGDESRNRLQKLLHRCPCHDIVYTLLKCGINPYYAPDGQDDTPMEHAILKGNIRAAVICLQCNIDPFHAIRRCHGEMSAALMEQRAMTVLKLMQVCGLDLNTMLSTMRAVADPSEEWSNAVRILGQPMSLVQSCVRKIRITLRRTNPAPVLFFHLLHPSHYFQIFSISRYARDLILFKQFENQIPGLVEEFDKACLNP